LLLGVWQLNRATEKEPLLARLQIEVPFDQWTENQPLSQTEVSGHFQRKPVFLTDNKTHNGQFGYEVFCLLSTGRGAVAVSLGWVAGSQNCAQPVPGTYA
jgi:surfeit locus 1 family protein